jgi:hypothetical protein
VVGGERRLLNEKPARRRQFHVARRSAEQLDPTGLISRLFTELNEQITDPRFIDASKETYK